MNERLENLVDIKANMNLHEVQRPRSYARLFALFHSNLTDISYKNLLIENFIVYLDLSYIYDSLHVTPDRVCASFQTFPL